MLVLIVAIAAGIGYCIYDYISTSYLRDTRFAYGNGSLEATEINVATKRAGRLEKVFVKEGDFVNENDILAEMQTDELKADLKKARATLAQAVAKKEQAEAQKIAADATVKERESSRDGAKKRYDRDMELLKTSAKSKQEVENAETAYLTADAELEVAKAQVTQAVSYIKAAEADIEAAEAAISRILVDINDCTLKAPRSGRVQYLIAEPGEVLAAGGRILNLVDLTDVYMTFFLSEEIAGKVPLGAEVRLLLDAFKDVPIPAKVTYVASVAQFTPKTVETQVERQKLMYRVKAHINPRLLEQYREYVKTGLPGVAWIKMDNGAEWPVNLRIKESSLLARKMKELDELEKANAPRAIKNSGTQDQK